MSQRNLGRPSALGWEKPRRLSSAGHEGAAATPSRVVGTRRVSRASPRRLCSVLDRFFKLRKLKLSSVWGEAHEAVSLERRSRPLIGKRATSPPCPREVSSGMDLRFGRPCPALERRAPLPPVASDEKAAAWVLGPLCAPASSDRVRDFSPSSGSGGLTAVCPGTAFFIQFCALHPKLPVSPVPINVCPGGLHSP